MSDDRLWEDGGSASIFRPSYSSTSLFCAGSLLPSMKADDSAGYDAAVGTIFHELIAEYQLNGRPDYALGQTRDVVNGDTTYTIEIDEDMFIHADECLRRAAEIPGERYVETRVDISHLTPIPGQSGTCDLAVCGDGILDITDWKYGKGVRVDALKNTQLLCYASGFFHAYDHIYDFQTIRLRIAQPRLGHWDVWEITRDELLAFDEWARDRWAAAWLPNADRSPGPKQCQWCKVRTDCAAMEAARQAIADETFDILDEITVSHNEQKAVVSSDTAVPHLEPPIQLPTERLARIYRFRGMMEAWFKDIGEELTRRGLQGDDLGGMWKVVNGRPGKRKWVDEDAAVQAFAKLGVPEDALYETKLISPLKTEKLVRAAGVKGKLGQQYVNLFTDRSAGKPTLVAIGDNRADVGSIVDDSFEGEDGGEL
jgi:hypothetical protein